MQPKISNRVEYCGMLNYSIEQWYWMSGRELRMNINECEISGLTTSLGHFCLQLLWNLTDHLSCGEYLESQLLNCSKIQNHRFEGIGVLPGNQTMGNKIIKWREVWIGGLNSAFHSRYLTILCCDILGVGKGGKLGGDLQTRSRDTEDWFKMAE